MKKSIILLAFVVALSAVCSPAEDLELFRASKLGDSVWVWGGARLKKKGDVFTITEHSQEADYGDVFMADKIPFFKDALVDIVIQNATGAVTLQALGFKGDDYLGTHDLLSQIAEPGSYSLDFKGAVLPEESERILFKLWIGGEEGATASIRDLVYRLPVKDENILINDRFAKTAQWETQDTLIGVDVAGAKLTLQPGKTFGAILYLPLIPKDENTLLLLDTPVVLNGNISVQVVAFDDIGEYLRSIDVLKEVGAGMHVVDMGAVSWPPQSEQYRIKIWIGGAVNAEALLSRMLLIRK